MTRHHRRGLAVAAALLLSAALSSAVFAADPVKLDLPLGRTNYQDNEWIDVAVVRSSAAALNAGTLTLTLTSADNSKLTFNFPVKAAAVADGSAQDTANLRLDGWLIRPGEYTLDVAVDGATAQSKLTIYSHVRKSTYKTIHWGGSRDATMKDEGVDGLGFNIAMGQTGQESIASGQDVMGNCLMGGGHQHDLRLTNDWSDPNVYIGAIQRGVDRAFGFRTMPNAIGAHLHDEPGLTWAVHPHTKAMSPHDIKEQREAYQRAFNEEQPWFDQIDTKTPEGLAKWEKICEFKLGFMDAFWKASAHALEQFKPGYLSVTQSQYGWTAFHDGYYFNVVRSMPVVSGHGGYNDYWLMNMNPSFYLEFSLPRQLDKPTWYLPGWYDDTPELFRENQYLSFITGIQGLSTAPGENPKCKAAPAISETNHLEAKIGTIFEKPEYTHQDLAVLYSKSNVEYGHYEFNQPATLGIIYVATRLDHYPINVVLDEDIIDGSLAANNKAIVLAGLNYLDPAVISGLESFAKAGGVVIETADCKVDVAGAVKLNVDPNELTAKAHAAAKALTDPAASKAAAAQADAFTTLIEFAKPTAKALGEALVAKGIQPAFTSDVDTLAAGKQVRGEIEYDFTVNFTPKQGMLGSGASIATKATINLPADGRPVYEIVSGEAKFSKKGSSESTTVDMGPSAMLAFVRTARPIGGVQVSPPVINRDYTRENEPAQRIDLSATLQDSSHGLLAGSAPMQVVVTDPSGKPRYDLYRAATLGVMNLSLPLAANDPAGKWTVTVTELISNKSGSASFNYNPAPQCGVLAGAQQRAIFFWADKQNIYNFIRNNRQISIVAGEGDYNQAAAKRLVEILAPYNVTATIVPLTEALKPREITDEQALTWCGNSLAGTLDANTRKQAALVGFNLPQPTIVLGNAKNNPLIAFLTTSKVLPYTPSATFPGRGQGMIAWNTLTLGHDVDAIALIADDADGINQAVGTLFQLGVGLDPLTPLALPTSNSVTPAK